MAQDLPPFGVLGFEVAAFIVLALLLAVVGWRGRETGVPWMVAGLLLAAAWYAVGSGVPSTGPDIEARPEQLWSVVIAAAVLAVSTGVVRYLGLPSSRWRWAVWACGLPGVCMIAALLAGQPVSHRAFHIGVLFAYGGAAALAFRRAATMPGDGHGVLGLALAAQPITPFAMLAFGAPPGHLKYIAGLTLVIFGMVFLTVSLLRRHRALVQEGLRRNAAEAALRDANARLEARVQERTAHLHELIAGLESFNRGVSHDLRGPLGGMSSLARMAAQALDGGDDTLARRALPTIARQCDDSERMVGTMLDLARIGEVSVCLKPVDPGDIAREAFAEVMLGAPDVPAPQFEIAALPWVRADRQLLRAVFVNLIGNALKFSRSAALPRVAIDAQAEGMAVRLCVHDNGVGFDADQAARLFEPFYRGHAGGFQGHGLGLSIVRRAVEAMGGTVGASGRPGQGATLHFSLPSAPGIAVAPEARVRAGGAVAHS